MDLRRFLPILLAFTLGALCSEVRALHREIALNVAVECAYHEGLDEGFRTAGMERR